MPSGKVHAATSVVLSVPCAVGAGLGSGNPVAAAGAGVGCLAGLVLTPDLDQEGISHSEWQIIKCTFGLGFLWLMFWWPYAVMFRHRDWLSHAPLVGTLTRVIYIIVPLVVVAVMQDWDLTAVPSAAWEFLAWAFGGLCVSDTAHFVEDLLL